MSKSKQFKPLRHLSMELNRLKRIHDVSIFSYQQTTAHLKERLNSQEIRGDTALYLDVAGDDHLLARSPFEMISRLKQMYPEILRESLFVRSISAFEVFTVDTIWEISKRSLEPFKRQDKIIEYPQAQLLSIESIEEIKFEIINSECRQITSQGFNYAKKFFDSRLKIKFSEASVALKVIEEIHDRRHLFVHRGGKLDATYQLCHFQALCL